MKRYTREQRQAHRAAVEGLEAEKRNAERCVLAVAAGQSMTKAAMGYAARQFGARNGGPQLRRYWKSHPDHYWLAIERMIADGQLRRVGWSAGGAGLYRAA